jgi:hypothetical protein
VLKTDAHSSPTVRSPAKAPDVSPTPLPDKGLDDPNARRQLFNGEEEAYDSTPQPEVERAPASSSSGATFAFGAFAWTQSTAAPAPPAPTKFALAPPGSAVGTPRDVSTDDHLVTTMKQTAQFADPSATYPNQFTGADTFRIQQTLEEDANEASKVLAPALKTEEDVSSAEAAEERTFVPYKSATLETHSIERLGFEECDINEVCYGAGWSGTDLSPPKKRPGDWRCDWCSLANRKEDKKCIAGCLPAYHVEYLVAAARGGWYGPPEKEEEDDE